MSDANLIRDLATAGLDPDLLQRVVLELARGQAAIAAADKAEAERAAKVEAATAAKREANAERQRRFRERNNACHALRAVTERDEALPPQRSPTPPKTIPPEDTPSDPKGSSAPKGADRQRGSRLPDDFCGSEEARAVCAEMGLTPPEIGEALAEFGDYWRGVPGARGRKLDWPATLRNRLREVGRRPAARPPRGPPPGQRSRHGPLSLLASLNGADHDPPGSHDDHRTLDHDPSDGGPHRALREPDGGSPGRSWPEDRVRFLRSG